MRIGEADAPGPAGGIDDPAPGYVMDESDLVVVEDSRRIFYQPGEEHSAALDRAPPAFAPSVAFRGARPGTVYTTGAQGLGYYRDTPLAERAAASPGALEGTAARLPPVVIALSDLLCTDADEAAPRRTRRRQKRRPKRKRGRRSVKIA